MCGRLRLCLFLKPPILSCHGGEISSSLPSAHKYHSFSHPFSRYAASSKVSFSQGMIGNFHRAIFIECQLCVRYCARHQQTSRKGNTAPASSHSPGYTGSEPLSVGQFLRCKCLSPHHPARLCVFSFLAPTSAVLTTAGTPAPLLSQYSFPKTTQPFSPLLPPLLTRHPKEDAELAGWTLTSCVYSSLLGTRWGASWNICVFPACCSE